MKSHYDKELWGLTINPKNSNQIATGGGDRTLRIWDIKKNKQIFIKILDEDFRAIDWASNGKFIVIGTLNGSIYHLNLENNKLSKRFESIFYSGKNAKIDKKTNLYEKWIQEIKISPNSSFVAFGSHCGVGKTHSKLQILSIEKNLKEPLKNFCIIDPKITSALTHLDWGNDNDTIVVNSL
jgi:microtubule-associated protein-like 6